MNQTGLGGMLYCLKGDWQHGDESDSLLAVTAWELHHLPGAEP